MELVLITLPVFALSFLCTGRKTARVVSNVQGKGNGGAGLPLRGLGFDLVLVGVIAI